MVESGRLLAETWATAWATDPAQLAAGCYTADAALTVTDGLLAAGDATHRVAQVAGREAIAAEAGRVATAVPDRRVELLRLIDAETVVVAEWLFVGRGVEDVVAMGAPGLTWWELGADGRIARELRLVDWRARRIVDDEVRAAPPAPHGPGRSHGWFRDLAERLLEVAIPYPELAAASAYRDNARRVAVVAAATEAAPAVVLRGVAGDRSVVALRLSTAVAAASDADAVVVLELDDSDRIVSERDYNGGWWPIPG